NRFFSDIECPVTVSFRLVPVDPFIPPREYPYFHFAFPFRLVVASSSILIIIINGSEVNPFLQKKQREIISPVLTTNRNHIMKRPRLGFAFGFGGEGAEDPAPVFPK